MKILYYSSHPGLALNSSSGWGTHMREMIGAFRSHGHDVHPVIMGGTEDYFNSQARRSAWDQAKINFKRLVPGVIWESAKDLDLLRKDRRFESVLSSETDSYGPDVIYERSHQLQLSGIRVAKKHGIRHIMEFNTPYLDIRNKNSLLVKRANRIEKTQLIETGRAVFVTDVLKRFLESKHNLSITDARIASNAVDPSKLPLDPEEVDRIKMLPTLRGRTVVGFVGALFEWHRVDILIDAASRLRSHKMDFALLIVGDGSVVPDLKHQVESLGLNEHVLFTGRVPHEQVFNYIEVMDIAVQPSADWYQSPIKLFEYGAKGKPIVAPDIDAIREIVTHGTDGILVPEDISGLARGIQALLDEPELRDRLAQSFHQKILNNYTWDKIAATILDR